MVSGNRFMRVGETGYREGVKQERTHLKKRRNSPQCYLMGRKWDLKGESE